MAALFHTVIYQPIYNALALIVALVPGGDVGIGIIVLTIVVRFVLFPLSMSAIKSQIAMNRVGPALKALQDEHKDDKEALGKKTMELFRENKINPFSSFLLILIQLPVIIGLYVVLRAEAKQISFDPSVLYPFVHAPVHVSLMFLGILNLTGKSFVLAAIVAVTQFFYARLLRPSKPPVPKPTGHKASFQEDMASNMQLQMQYVFPFLMAAVSYFATSAIALYFIASNAFSILQEIVVQKIHGKR